MEPDRYYREVPVWSQQDFWMIEYGALARWPEMPTYPLFSLVLTAPDPVQLAEQVDAAIDWLLDGPCGYAVQMTNKSDKQRREYVHTDKDD